MHLNNFIDNSILSYNLRVTDDNKTVKNNSEKSLKENSYLEIIVPTCSYRMGEKRIGYGMAVIGK